MFLPEQPTDEVCTTSYEYSTTPSSSSVLATTTKTCQQPLVTFSLFFLDGIVIVLTAYCITEFIKKKYL